MKRKRQEREKDREKRKETIKQMNNYSEFKLFLAWILSMIGGVFCRYNWSDLLRRVTLIQMRVLQDINIYHFFRNLQKLSNSIQGQVQLQNNSVKPLKLYFKQILQSQSMDFTHPNRFIAEQCKKNKLSPYEQMKIFKALQSGVKLQDVFDKKVLMNALNLSEQMYADLNFATNSNPQIDSSSLSQIEAGEAERQHYRGQTLIQVKPRQNNDQSRNALFQSHNNFPEESQDQKLNVNHVDAPSDARMQDQPRKKQEPSRKQQQVAIRTSQQEFKPKVLDISEEDGSSSNSDHQEFN